MSLRVGRFSAGLCALFAVAVWAAPADDFKAANQLYDAGKYAEAAAAYEKIEPKTANVYYNLGNAYYRDGQPGEAILNYRRARLLSPRDPDILANLRFTEQRAGVNEVNAPSRVWHRVLQTAVFSRTLNEWAGYELGSIWLTVTAIAAARWLRKGRTVLVVAAAACLAALALTAGALVYRVALARSAPTAVVVVKHTDARFAPLADATVHFPLEEGTAVAIKEDRGRWLFVERADGQQGWVNADTLGRILSH